MSDKDDERLRKTTIAFLKDFAEQGYENAVECIDWLEKQSESDETKAKTFLINKGYPIDANGVFPTYEEMYNMISEGFRKQGEKKSIECNEEYDHLRQHAIDFMNHPDLIKATPTLAKHTIDWLKSLESA